MTFEYYPPGQVAAEFLQSKAFFRGLMGPIGSGKTTACIMDLFANAAAQNKAPDGIRYSRFVIVRNTYAELQTTTIKSWFDWFPRHIGHFKGDSPPVHAFRIGDVDVEVIFMALDRPDDVGKVLSLEVSGAWVNEAREVPKAVIDALTGRIGRYPNAARGGCRRRFIVADTNPPDTDHWWFKFSNQPPEGWAFFRQPGGLDPRAENLNYLLQDQDSIKLPLDHPDRVARGIEYYRQATAGKDPAWVNVYVNAEYGSVMTGKPVFPEYRDSLHCQDIEYMPGLPLWVGLDFGLTPAAVIGQRTAMGAWVVLDEIISDNMGADNFAKLLNGHLAANYPASAVVNVIGDPAGDQRAQTDERTPFMILKANGIEAKPAPSNDFVLRREAVAMSLSRLIDGVPGLRIHPRCSTLRKGMLGGYSYRRIQTSQERFTDKPDKNMYSHVADALQYMLLGGGEGKTVVNRVSNVYNNFDNMNPGYLARMKSQSSTATTDPWGFK